MPRRTKEERAAYMRAYRARKPAPNVDYTGMESLVQSTLPTYLAAPIDTCPLCGHDRQESDHLGGRPCRFKTSPRRNCGCSFEGF